MADRDGDVIAGVQAMVTERGSEPDRFRALRDEALRRGAVKLGAVKLP